MHHSSEEYNLITALRQSIFQQHFSGFFSVPFAVLGVPPVAILVQSNLNALYQFWIHTKAISRLPFPLEHILNTPSHHRVHHGRNRFAIDKNYGGTLIIWDRMFGTFQWEEQEVVYGLTRAFFPHSRLLCATSIFSYVV